jgi:putative transposase
MPVRRKKLKRWENVDGCRYLTFSTFGRLPLLGHPAIRDLVAKHLAAARLRCGFQLYAWVIMPEHLHVVLQPDVKAWPVSKVMVAIKQPIAQRVIYRWRRLNAPILPRLLDSDGKARFWQEGGGFDRNIRDRPELGKEIRYIHLNPVKRGLVFRPQDWPWSSARWYLGDHTGPVPIDPLPPPMDTFTGFTVSEMEAWNLYPPSTS